MDINLLKEILAIQSCSYDSKLMEIYIRERCKKFNYDYVEEDGNFYIRKGESTTYPCIVAHTDTVHRLTEDLTVVQIGDNLTGFNAIMMEQTGIGGDDKVGIYIAMEALLHFEAIKVAFFRDEEVGCDGSYNADMSFFFDCRFVLQCDRKGNKDFITNASGVALSSKAFQKAIKPIIVDYGYKFEHGYMTDVMALKEMGLTCAAANMSCGYYNPHSDNEYVNIPDTMNCLAMVLRIMEEVTEPYFHKAAKKAPYQYFYGGGTTSTKDYATTSRYNTFDGDDEWETDELTNKKYKKIPANKMCECCLGSASHLQYLGAYNMMVCDSCYQMEKQMTESYNEAGSQDSFSEIEEKIDEDIRRKRNSVQELNTKVMAIVKELKKDGVKLPAGAEQLLLAHSKVENDNEAPADNKVL